MWVQSFFFFLLYGRKLRLPIYPYLKPYMKRKDDESVVKNCCGKKYDSIKGSEVVSQIKEARVCPVYFFNKFNYDYY